MARMTTNDDSRIPNGGRLLTMRIASAVIATAAIASAAGVLNLWRNDSLRAAEIKGLKEVRIEDRLDLTERLIAIETRINGIDAKLDMLKKDVALNETQVQLIRASLGRIEKGAP